MARKMILVCGAALLLSACSSYPRLVAITPVAAAPDSHSRDVDAALVAASSLQAEYSTGYMDSAQIRDFSQLPIIGAAAVAAWILLDAHTGAARRVGRIGILAGAYSEARGQLVTPNMTEVYIAGHAALTCVLAQGSYFSGQGAETRLTRMDTSLNTLTQAILSTSSIIAMQPTDNNADAQALLRTTRAAAELAITQARAAASAALSERMAYEGAGPVFWLAVSSISARVASRGRQRPNVDYRTLVTQFSPPAAGVKAQSGSNRTAAQITALLIPQIDALLNATADLRGVTPNYNDRLKLVADCPKEAG